MLLVTGIIAAPAMVLAPVTCPPPRAVPSPPAASYRFFIFLALMESVLFGLGISFLLFELPTVRRVSADSKARA